MSLSTHIKPISYLKANAAKIAQELKEDGEPYIITQNGEAAMVVQSVAEYERKENALAMMQMLQMSQRDIDEGNTYSPDEVFTRIRERLGVK